MSDFGNTIFRTARKEHRCEWCLQPISKGEKHAAFKGMWEDIWQNWKMHQECHDAVSKHPEILMDGFIPGEGKRGSIE